MRIGHARFLRRPIVDRHAPVLGHSTERCSLFLRLRA